MALRYEDVKSALESAGFGGLPDWAVARSMNSLEDPDGPSISEDFTAGTWITSMVDGLSRAVGRPEFRADLKKVEICVVRSDVMNACAVTTDDGPKIVIFTGFLKVLLYMSEFSVMVSIISENREKIRAATGLTDIEINSLGYRAFTLIAHFAGLGNPLPRAFPYLSPSERA